MRPATILTAALAGLFLPAFASVQQPWEPATTVEQGIARAVADAMPDATSSGIWRRRGPTRSTRPHPGRIGAPAG